MAINGMVSELCRICGSLSDDTRNIFVKIDGEGDDNLLAKLQTTFSIIVSFLLQ